ncbi:MAG: hypothetical protein J6G98_05535 [Bacilli bacterium]|nr:hypothetical protein [Bacilli bacterium]
MALTLCSITIVGLIIGSITIVKGNKKYGIIQILLNFILLLYSILFCLSKIYYNYNGSNEDYLLSKSFNNASFETIILLLIFVLLTSITFINFFDLIHIKEKYKNKLIKRLKMNI